MGKSSYGMIARLVWDGGDEVRVPEEMGIPRADQLQGTPSERLAEISGRVCYDSCGRGRSSADFHKHILEVGHLSVYEHSQMTVELKSAEPEIFLNRPGVWVETSCSRLRVTFNPRVVLEWDQWSRAIKSNDLTTSPSSIGDAFQFRASLAYPQIVASRQRDPFDVRMITESSKVVGPVSDEEKWVSMFLVMSRGASHEIVRHGDRTGISQRSSRFCNESVSEWIDHPLVQEYRNSIEVPVLKKEGMRVTISDVIDPARAAYADIVETLETWLSEKGIEKLTARKQARGAARGYLGNALATELIFSASVGQWKRMLRMRCSDAADGEIRAVFVEVLKELKDSRYKGDFDAFRLVPARDGIGMVAVEQEGKS